MQNKTQLQNFLSACKIKGAAALFLLLAWHLLAVILNMPALPPPAGALSAFFSDLNSGLGMHFAVSAYRVTASIAISFIIAVPLGLVLGAEPRWDRFAAPLIYLTYPVPKIVFLPVIIAIFGLGNLSKILLITIVISFQILVTARDAARQVNRSTIDLVTSLGAGKWGVYRHVIAPASLPDITTALRISSGTAIAVLFFSETVASRKGLGYYLMDAWARYSYDNMFAGIIAMGLLGFIIYMIIDFVDKKVCAWKYL